MSVLIYALVAFSVIYLAITAAGVTLVVYAAAAIGDTSHDSPRPATTRAAPT